MDKDSEELRTRLNGKLEQYKGLVKALPEPNEGRIEELKAVEIMETFNGMAENLEDSVKRLKQLGPQINPPVKDQILNELNHFHTS